MKREYILCGLNVITEFIFLYILYHLFSFDNVSILRYSFMYFMLGLLFGRFSIKTVLVWEQAKLIITSNLTFFLATNVMNSLHMWTLRYALSNICVSLIMSFIALLTNRFYRIWFRDYFARKVIIVGVNENTLELIDTIYGNRFSLSKLVAVVKTDKDETYLYNSINLPLLSSDNLVDIVHQYQIDEVLVSDMHRSQLLSILNDLRSSDITVKSVVKSNSLVTYQSRIEDFDGILLLTSVSPRKVYADLIKRCIDVCAGICGIILLLPIAVYVKIRYLLARDHDSIFFVQERIGRYGNNFKLFKFRTMIPNAEQELERLMEIDENIREEYSENKKLVNDPRVTPCGELLRKKSLDEFPQFINVLLGNMSLIGPRPYLPREKVDMGDYYKTIISSKPGITGMWQTHGRNDVGFKKRCQMDEFYIKNWSIWLDLTILFKTMRTVRKGDGAL